MSINEEKEKIDETKHKKKKIIKKKKKKIEETTTEATENEALTKVIIVESKTDDELGSKTKKIIKKKIKTERKTTTDVPTFVKKQEKDGEENINEEKKITKKKIIKKKIIKKKKKEDISVDNVKPKDNEEKLGERPEIVCEKITLNSHVENNDKDKNHEHVNNIRTITEAGDNAQENKDKFELPKIKMKRKNVQKRKKNKEEEKPKEENNNNLIEEKKEDPVKEDGQKQSNESIKEDKENNDKIYNEKENSENQKEEQIKNDNKENGEENKENKNETIEDISTKKEEKESTEIDESKTLQEEDNRNKIIIQEKQKENDKQEEKEEQIEKEGLEEKEKEELVEKEEKIEKETQVEKEIEKPKIDIINEIMQNIHLDEMRNYIGIVTNETIFEYLVLNYYSNEMKEFNLSLNELLFLEDIPLLLKLTNGKEKDEKVYHTFNNYLFNNSDIIPIFNEKVLEGFIYPKDFFYYIYNCESQQSLTNEEFLIDLYKDIDEEKPYGKNRVCFLELNDSNK